MPHFCEAQPAAAQAAEPLDPGNIAFSEDPMVMFVALQIGYKTFITVKL